MKPKSQIQNLPMWQKFKKQKTEMSANKSMQHVLPSKLRHWKDS